MGLIESDDSGKYFSKVPQNRKIGKAKSLVIVVGDMTEIRPIGAQAQKRGIILSGVIESDDSGKYFSKCREIVKSGKQSPRNFSGLKSDRNPTDMGRKLKMWNSPKWGSSKVTILRNTSQKVP